MFFCRCEHFCIDGIGQRHGDAIGGDEIGVPDGDRRLAVARHGGFAVGVDRGDEVFTAVEFGPTRHVLTVSIRVPGANEDLQSVLRLEDRRSRQQFQAHNARSVAARSRSDAGDPVGHDEVICRARFDLLSAAVRHCLRRFEQHETAPGSLRSTRRLNACRVSTK